MCCLLLPAVYLIEWFLLPPEFLGAYGPDSSNFMSNSGVLGASLVAQLVKNLPAMQETWVQFLGWVDPLEKEMAIHSSTLAWKIPWLEEPDRLQSMGSQRVGHN